MAGITKDDLGLGDVVRLSIGATVTVEGVWDSYTDAEGLHEGPFITLRGTHEYRLVSDVVEIVERNPRRCVFCGGGVTSTNPETDFCRNCHYSGEPIRRELTAGTRDLLGQIDEIDEVATVGVWHTGGGCFNLAVTLADGRLLTPSEGYTDDTGEVWGEPGIPTGEGDSLWAFVVAENEEAWSEWDEDRLAIPNVLMNDAQLVEAIRKIATESKTVAEAKAVAEALRPKRKFIANVLGEGEALIDEPITVESYDAENQPQLPVGDEGVVVLYGDADGVTCIVEAESAEDAERRIIATWSDSVTIDDLQEAVEIAPRR